MALNKYDKQHLRNLTAYERQVDAIYRAAVKEAAALGLSIRDLDPTRLFSFSDYPITRKRLESLLESLKSGLSAVIVNGVNHEWTLANNKNNELCRQVFGDNVGKLSNAQYRRYFKNNEEARDAFLARKVQGLNLSDRVWKYTNQFKEEIELGLDIGLRSGKAAERLQKDLQLFLQHPDMLFRRVRDEHGQLVLSKRAAAFHPGRGVYRSSYKNARRLAATETNIAYRSADFARWQDLDFVVGIRVVLSNNHTLLGADGKPHKFTDICDELSAPVGSKAVKGQGCYPKDFKFTGWHPHCRCHAETILKTEEEMMRDNERLLKGEEPLKESVNTVTGVPQEFDDWLKDNKERAKRSTSMPYFISDNEKYLPEGYKNLYALKTPYETYAEYEAAMRFNKKHADFTPEVLKNIRDLDQALPVMQGKIMNFTEADRGHANPHFPEANSKEAGYHDNCQTCTMAYELRRRGFPVEAVPNPIADGYKNMRDFSQFCARNGIEWTDRYLIADGKAADYAWSHRLTEDTVTAKNAFIEAQTAAHGRYEVYCAWKTGNAHVFIVERQKNGELLWFDPQTARRGKSFNDSLALMIKEQIGVLRIDDKIINPKFASRLLKASR
jgi:hypothetical protein